MQEKDTTSWLGRDTVFRTPLPNQSKCLGHGLRYRRIGVLCAIFIYAILRILNEIAHFKITKQACALHCTTGPPAGCAPCTCSLVDVY